MVHGNGETKSKDAMQSRSGASSARLLRAIWMWNTAQLLVDNAQVNRFITAARAINLTDVYLYVAPQWYDEKGADLASFNATLNAAGIRVWALDGDVKYIDSPTAEETFMDGLRGLAAFNEQVVPEARFHGFQADIRPQDSPEHSGYFHNGIPMSKLTVEQQTQRDMLMHKWLNALTRASAFLRSYDTPFGVAMPYWLHDLGGEPVTVNWVSVCAGKTSATTCIMDLIMPLCDEYVIMGYSTDPAIAAGRILQQARYASARAIEEHKVPRVLGSVNTAKYGGSNASYADTPGKESQEVVLGDMRNVEKTLQKYPAFSGMAIHHWESWDELPSSSVPNGIHNREHQQQVPPQSVSAIPTKALDDRLSSVIQSLEVLRPSG